MTLNLAVGIVCLVCGILMIPGIVISQRTIEPRFRKVYTWLLVAYTVVTIATGTTLVVTELNMHNTIAQVLDFRNT